MRTDLLSTLTRRVLFAPLADQGRADVVAVRLRTAITLGVLAEGDQLPSEAELAAQFNISPVTLREALTQLRDQGLVTTRRGRGGGTVVSAPLPDQVRAAVEQVRPLAGLDLRDLADWRRAIAAESASLAARRASNENLALLERGSARLSTTGDEVEARRADSRFLIELAAASQSVRLSTSMISLQVEYAPLLTLVYADADMRTAVGEVFADAVRAIRAADADVARRRVVQAVDHVAVRVAELRAGGWSL